MLLEVLGSGGPETENVTVLLKALQKSLIFEKEMQGNYEDDDGSPEGGAGGNCTVDDNGNIVELSAAEKIRRKYNKQRESNETDGARASAGAPKSRFASLAVEVCAPIPWTRASHCGPSVSDPFDLRDHHSFDHYKGSEIQEAAEEADTVLPIPGRLSGVFDPFLGPYISLERKVRVSSRSALPVASHLAC